MRNKILMIILIPLLLCALNTVFALEGYPGPPSGVQRQPSLHEDHQRILGQYSIAQFHPGERQFLFRNFPGSYTRTSWSDTEFLITSDSLIFISKSDEGFFREPIIIGYKFEALKNDETASIGSLALSLVIMEDGSLDYIYNYFDVKLAKLQTADGTLLDGLLLESSDFTLVLKRENGDIHSARNEYIFVNGNLNISSIYLSDFASFIEFNNSEYMANTYVENNRITLHFFNSFDRPPFINLFIEVVGCYAFARLPSGHYAFLIADY